ncbi:LuxR C-terminal-related transcriptional regulator [Aminobacter aminovorans]|uniref:helix-turn-helix transcriptional regulator n=1 Tax=Aminobacter aminovorans TaxID=83263 RepID=UPI002858F511|nr:LuxR C-terminal-related transcriptional regulator [Aminobacter aminovorans]MDR7224125.1 DNA-binding CsgD family transcriptional regulator [Aminobacter aminovorans]
MTVIPDQMIARWQRIVNLLAELLDVPAGLVMEANPPKHTVLVSSKSDGNPYEVGDDFTLHTGLYCDEVMDNDAPLLVRDASLSEKWRNNPDIKHGMSFYHGFPLSWPDGRIFGTICVLDGQDNPKAAQCAELLAEFKASIDADLVLLAMIEERMKLFDQLSQSRDQLEERVMERTAELSETNAALRVLLRRFEEARSEAEEQIAGALAQRVLPHIEPIRAGISPSARARLDLLEAGLKDLTSTFSRRLAVTLADLTPTESEIVQMIVQGHSTKEIARAINRAMSTVDFHRNNIRRKLGLNSQKVSLRSHLNSLRG